jgi:hypothetical protein
VTKEAATTMYQQACALLARLCPEWWSRAHLTEWSQVGSIEHMFRGQYCRMLNGAWTKDREVEVDGARHHVQETDVEVGE